ncbi:hypothetical protein Tco_0983315 [Tanacetum coccineum]
MAAVEVPQTLELQGWQLNAPPVLEMENLPTRKELVKEPEGQWIAMREKHDLRPASQKFASCLSSASVPKPATVKNKGLIAEAYEWDEEEVSSDDNEMVEVKVLMAQSEENDDVIKEGARNGEWVKISMRRSSVLGKWNRSLVKRVQYRVERPWLSEAKGFILPNHDTGIIFPAESQRNTTDPSVVISDSSND